MEYTYNYNKTDTRESYIRLKKKKKSLKTIRMQLSQNEFQELYMFAPTKVAIDNSALFLFSRYNDRFYTLYASQSTFFLILTIREVKVANRRDTQIL